MGKNADEANVEEIIELAGKTSFSDQQIQVHENVHSQLKTFCAFMDEILIPNEKMLNDPLGLSNQSSVLPRRSGLSLAVGRSDSSADNAGEFSPLSFGFLCNVFVFYETFLVVNRYSYLGLLFYLECEWNEP